MSTFLQLAQSLRQEAGVAGAIATCQNQTGELKRIVDWINQAWMQIQNQHRNWLWMRQSLPGTGLTVIGTDLYTPTMLGVPTGTFGDWYVDSLRIQKQSIGLADQTWMPSMEFNAFRDTYKIGVLPQARPNLLTVNPQLSIWFHPVPDAVYVVTGDYQQCAQPLVNDGDVPAMPAQFHQVIVHRALQYYARYEAAGEIQADAVHEYNAMMGELRFNQLPPPLDSAPLA